MSFSEDPLNSSFQRDELFTSSEIILKPCKICGRTFKPDSLERHETVCEKSKKWIRRNVFNSFSQRVKELGSIPVYNDLKDEDKKKCRKEKEEQDNATPVAKCKKKCHQKFLNNGLSHEKKLPMDYQQCPSCNRYFNQKAADRHIAWCTEQQTRLPKTPPNSEALERLKARVKYQAPMPKKKDQNARLIKSADPVRELSLKRTYSSPSIPLKEIRASREKRDEKSNMSFNSPTHKKVEQSSQLYHSVSSHNISQPETHTKKAVKFKEIFPVYKKERNKNLDMLAALKLRLTEMEVSDNDCFMKANENINSFKKNNQRQSFMASRDICTSDGEAHGSQSSSSEGSLPPHLQVESSQQRMPRFCYNCGTKYPIVSAKFCCECGARRFIFGENNNLIYT